MISNILLIFHKDAANQLWNSPIFPTGMIPYFTLIDVYDYYALIVMRLEENTTKAFSVDSVVPLLMQQLASVIISGSIDPEKDVVVHKVNAIPFDWNKLKVSQMPIWTGPLDLDQVVLIRSDAND